MFSRNFAISEITYSSYLFDMWLEKGHLQGGSNMTGTNCDLFTHKSSRSYLNHLVHNIIEILKYVRLLNFNEDITLVLN